MTNTEFRDSTEGFHADKVKIVACEGRESFTICFLPIIILADNAVRQIFNLSQLTRSFEVVV